MKAFLLLLLLPSVAQAQSTPPITWDPNRIPGFPSDPAPTPPAQPLPTAPLPGSAPSMPPAAPVDNGVNKIMAKVDNAAITLGDVERAKEGKNIDNSTALNNIINDRILDAELIRERIDVSNEELEQAVQEVAMRQKVGIQELFASLEAKGISQEAFENGIRSDLQKNRFLQKVILPRVQISDAEIQAYYAANPKDFPGYGSYRFLEILIAPNSTPQGQDVRDFAASIIDQLKKGADFSTLARRYSQGAFASTGGDSGMLSSQQIRPDLVNVLNQLPLNAASEPISTPNGIMILKVLDRRNPMTRPLTEVTEEARQKVFAQKAKVELDKYLNEMRVKHFVQIMP